MKHTIIKTFVLAALVALAPFLSALGLDEESVKIFSGEPRLLIVHGYSTSQHWWAFLQRKIGGCKSLSVNWSLGISSSSPFRGRRSEGERSEPNADDPGRGCDTRFASLVAGHAGLFVVATKHSNTQVPHDPPKRL